MSTISWCETLGYRTDVFPGDKAPTSAVDFWAVFYQVIIGFPECFQPEIAVITSFFVAGYIMSAFVNG